MNKIKIIAICGKAGTEKEKGIICKWIMSRFPHTKIIQKVWTDTSGKKKGDYSVTDFCQKILNMELVEVSYNHQQSSIVTGTLKRDLDTSKINIGFYDEMSLDELEQSNDIQLFSIYIDIADKIRLRRLLQSSSFSAINICNNFLLEEKNQNKYQKSQFDYIWFRYNLQTLHKLKKSIKAFVQKD